MRLKLSSNLKINYNLFVMNSGTIQCSMNVTLVQRALTLVGCAGLYSLGSQLLLFHVSTGLE